MDILLILFLIMLSLLGKIILVWHKVAGDGFGLGQFNTPLALRNKNTAGVVWLVGCALWLGSIALIWNLSSGYWAAAAFFVTVSIDKILFAKIFQRDIEYCANALEKFKRENDINPKN